MSLVPPIHENHLERAIGGFRIRWGLIEPCGDPTCSCGGAKPVVLMVAAHEEENRWLAFSTLNPARLVDELAETWHVLETKPDTVRDLRTDAILFGVPWSNFEYGPHAPRMIQNHQTAVSMRTPARLYETPVDQLLTLRRAIRPVHDPRVVHDLLMTMEGYHRAGLDHNSESPR